MLCVERIEVGRERERKHRAKKNVSPYNFQSNFKKKICRVIHVFKIILITELVWKITL